MEPVPDQQTKADEASFSPYEYTEWVEPSPPSRPAGLRRHPLSWELDDSLLIRRSQIAPA